MRLSELARNSGISVPTIKYYLREGLLPPGFPISATQADYNDTHASRLTMIRALIDVGGLSVATVRSVLSAIDTGPQRLASAIDQVHDALAATSGPSADLPHRALAALTDLGWQVDPDSAVLRQLDTALAAADQVGLPTGAPRLRVYADAALAMAEYDIASIPTGHDAQAAAAAVTYVVLGTVLYEPLLLALRRLAQEQVYRRTYQAAPDATSDGGSVTEEQTGNAEPATTADRDTEGKQQ